nr:hypothetical protein Iba_chr10cCG1540 [Ipomoea batatas]
MRQFSNGLPAPPPLPSPTSLRRHLTQADIAGAASGGAGSADEPGPQRLNSAPPRCGTLAATTRGFVDAVGANSECLGSEGPARRMREQEYKLPGHKEGSEALCETPIAARVPQEFVQLYWEKGLASSDDRVSGPTLGGDL